MRPHAARLCALSFLVSPPARSAPPPPPPREESTRAAPVPTRSRADDARRAPSDRARRYRGYYWNALVTATSLRALGSTADFVILVMMGPTANWTALPAGESAALARAGATLEYVGALDGGPTSFTQLAFAKAYCWRLTQYRAVQFLDGASLAAPPPRRASRCGARFSYARALGPLRAAPLPAQAT